MMKISSSLNDIDKKLFIESGIYKRVGGANEFFATSFSSFKQNQLDLPNNSNSSKMINSNQIHKINTMNEILSFKISTNNKNIKNNFLFDPSINNDYCTQATFKYLFLFLTTSGLIISFSYMFFVSVYYCSYLSSNLSLYLLLMGLSGLLRIIIFYSCPFDYSKSILNKMYEHLIWRLCINRIKNSYYLAVQTENNSQNSDNRYRCNESKSACLFSYELCCCSCICFKRIFFRREKNIPLDRSLINNLTNKNDSLLSINITNLSTISVSTTSMIINEMDCFKCSKLINKKNKNSLSTTTSSNSSSFKKLYSSSLISAVRKSKSTSDLETIAKRKKYLREIKKKHKLINKNNYNHHYGNRYFYGKYDNKYGTHKKLRYHHNRTYKPYRLIDSNSIRYGVFHLIQRFIDVFMISWFVVGNYWVFNSNESQHDLELNISNNNLISSKSKFINRKKEIYNKLNITNSFTLNVKMNQTGNITRLISIRLDLNSICYQTAFYQIISTYSIFFCFFILVISYRIYLVHISKRSHHHRYRCNRNKTNLTKKYQKKNEDVSFLRYDSQVNRDDSKIIRKSLTCPQL